MTPSGTYHFMLGSKLCISVSVKALRGLSELQALTIGCCIGYGIGSSAGAFSFKLGTIVTRPHKRFLFDTGGGSSSPCSSYNAIPGPSAPCLETHGKCGILNQVYFIKGHLHLLQCLHQLI